jgi:ribose transport system ATP-binding protein
MSLLELRGLKKSYGATRALDGVDLEVAAGEVHAVVGENGAGKSTLMNVLSGLIQPDAGTMRFGGHAYRPSGPPDARSRGIAHIHQELSLCPHLSVAENILLGMEPARHGWLDWSALEARAAQILRDFDHPGITPRDRVASLPLAARQVVEISRALAGSASLILMDEPTSSLQGEDVARLFACIRRLRDAGISVIYISHFLEEVREVADRVTVLRDGASVMSGPLSQVSDAEIITAMVGRSVANLFPPPSRRARGERALEVEGLVAPPAVRQASFELYEGEVLGIAGLIGSGRTEMIRALLGLLPMARGHVTIGKARAGALRPEEALARGVGYLSEDRKGEGLALSLSIADNITLTNFASCSRWGWLDLAAQARQSAVRVDQLHIRARTPQLPVAKLSGGNQQKVAIARLLHQGATIVLLDEPTRGVDVGSKAQIYQVIAEMAAAGKSVVVVSSYLPELFGLCDRLAVMVRGVLSPARPIAQWTPELVMQEAIGGKPVAIGAGA